MTVWGVDISDEAIRLAQEDFPRVHFAQIDILNNKDLKKIPLQFDYVFDRGCFHVIAPESRSLYLKNLNSLIRPGGIYFLKTFSEKQASWEYGPYRFNPQEIKNIFEKDYICEKFFETIYQGVIEPAPLALFCVLIKR